MKKFLLFISLCIFISFANAQDNSAKLKIAEQKLSDGKMPVSQVLMDTFFMSLHSITPFRELIKSHAKAEKICIVTAKEPGTRITVKVFVTDASGIPQKNALVYLYHTSNEGWYSDTAAHILMNEGDRRHARLFGYCKTDDNGSFELLTIKPKGYPNSNLQAHIHIEVNAENGKSLISELLFDDDPRLVGDIRQRAINEGSTVAKNTGTEKQPIYSYVIKVH